MAITRLTPQAQPKRTIVVAKIKTPDKQEWEIPFGILSWHEWDDLVKDVRNPPVAVVVKQDGTRYEDHKDPMYLKALENAMDERLARRFITSLEYGGNEFTGNTLREKYENFKRQYDNVLAQTIVRVFDKAHSNIEAQVEILADSFRTTTEPAPNDARLSANGHEPSPIPELAL